MHQPGGARQQLADVRSRQAGGDGTEFAAFRQGTVGLRVPGFLLGMSTVEVEYDDRFRPTEGTLRRHPDLCLRAQQIGQQQPQAGQPAKLKYLAPGWQRGEKTILTRSAVRGLVSHSRFSQWVSRERIDSRASIRRTAEEALHHLAATQLHRTAQAV